MASDTATPRSADLRAHIDALWVFPVKSCAGISVQQVALTATGLAYDRAWMWVDAAGDMLTQREVPHMALIQPELRDDALWLHAPGMASLSVALDVSACVRTRVRVWDDVVPAFDMGAAATAWMGQFLATQPGPWRLVRFDTTHPRLSSAHWTQGMDALNQFNDGYPVLVSSTASLDELNSRLTQRGHPPVDMRRFRANVVLRGDGWGPHDEDRVDLMHIATEGAGVQLQPVKPCARCPIPNIDPDTAMPHTAVSDTLQLYRQDARVQGGVTFGMNAIVRQGVGAVLQVGQVVTADWAF